MTNRYINGEVKALQDCMRKRITEQFFLGPHANTCLGSPAIQQEHNHNEHMKSPSFISLEMTQSCEVQPIEARVEL